MMTNARWIGLVLSAALHAALLWGAALFVAQRVPFGLAPGERSVAVALVEGAAEAEVKPEPPPRPLPEEIHAPSQDTTYKSP